MPKQRKMSREDMQLTLLTGLFVLMSGLALGGVLTWVINKGLGTAVFMIAGSN